MGRAQASRTRQPIRRTPGAGPGRTGRALADQRILALAMSGAMDLGTDRTIAPMARLITPLLGGLLLIIALLSLSLGSTSVNMVGGLLDWLRGADKIGRASCREGV